MDEATLILDGDCGLCNRAAMFLRPRLGIDKKIILLPNDSQDGKEVINKLSTKKCLEKGTEMSSRVIQQIAARL